MTFAVGTVSRTLPWVPCRLPDCEHGLLYAGGGGARLLHGLVKTAASLRRWVERALRPHPSDTSPSGHLSGLHGRCAGTGSCRWRCRCVAAAPPGVVSSEQKGALGEEVRARYLFAAGEFMKSSF